MNKYWDVVIIGGGFFGLSIAEHLAEGPDKKSILIIEKENDFMQRASYNNQARVHNGYHYPRSLLTALRSRINFPNFVSQYESAIYKDFDKYYAIARDFSKVSARQFNLFSNRIEADIEEASSSIKKLFDDNLIENVFRVKEYAFNSKILKQLLLKRLNELDVSCQVGTEVYSVEKGDRGKVLINLIDGPQLQATHVFNCTYSMINKINIASKLPTVNLKHELAEMSLVKLPEEISDISVTVMCGPFFSFMPFPDRKLHTFSHVRYTPHSEWQDKSGDSYRDSHNYLGQVEKRTNFKHMISDSARYMPIIKNTSYKGSLWEVKTVLPTSETDDSRPILFKPHHGIPNYTCVMGGKLDNIYDVHNELDVLYV